MQGSEDLFPKERGLPQKGCNGGKHGDGRGLGAQARQPQCYDMRPGGNGKGDLAFRKPAFRPDKADDAFGLRGGGEAVPDALRAGGGMCNEDEASAASLEERANRGGRGNNGQDVPPALLAGLDNRAAPFFAFAREVLIMHGGIFAVERLERCRADLRGLADDVVHGLRFGRREGKRQAAGEFPADGAACEDAERCGSLAHTEDSRVVFVADSVEEGRCITDIAPANVNEVMRFLAVEFDDFRSRLAVYVIPVMFHAKFAL